MKISSYIIKQTGLVFCLLVIVLISISCGSGNVTNNAKQAALLHKLATNPADTEALEELLFVELVEMNMSADVVKRYESDRAVLQDRMMAHIYYATALCQMAGGTDKASDQLKFVRKGINEFDTLMRDFPNQAKVYIWQTITYSNFPEILGVDTIVLDNIKRINDEIQKGNWKLDDGERKLASNSLINLAREYKRKDYLELARKQLELDGFENDPELLKALADTEKKLI